MPQFRYIAVEASSETIEGRMEAATKSAVIDRLHASGHVPIRIDEVVASPLSGIDLSWMFRARRMPSRTLALLTGQLATLLHAGLALDEALGILRELATKEREQECLRLLLDRLAEFLERTQATKEHIISALIYPLVVAVTCLLSIGILFVFVVPRFRPIFEQAGDALPLPARSLMAASDFLQAYWWLCVAAPLLLAWVVQRQFKKPASRQRWEARLLKLPGIGGLIAKVEVVRFSRTLATLLKNGVSLLSALAITRETIRNSVFSNAVATVIERVKTGKGLAEPLAQTKVFPPLVVHLVRVGEESGRQDEMLFKVAEIFEGETRRSIDRMLALLGPALTVGLGLIVAAVIGSILTAVLSVYDLAM